MPIFRADSKPAPTADFRHQVELSPELRGLHLHCGVAPLPASHGFVLAEPDSPVFEPEQDNLGTAVAFLETALLADGQEHYRDEVLRFCAQHPDALHRSCLDGHLTASAYVVDLDREAVALIHHRKLGSWLQPGGHADGEGNLALVARTEVREEIGLEALHWALPAFDLNVHPIPARGAEPEHLHLDLRFLAIATHRQELVADAAETRGAAWIDQTDPRFKHVGDVAAAGRRALDLARALRPGALPNTGLTLQDARS